VQLTALAPVPIADLVRMSMSKESQEISVHRTAGLAGQLNIETVAPAAFSP
jgi:hypothetical protein